MTTPTTPAVSDIPTQIFEAFLHALSEAHVGEDTVERLRKTLLEDVDLSDRALKSAIAPEETLP